jgi:hypothetical protein
MVSNSQNTPLAGQTPIMILKFASLTAGRIWDRAGKLVRGILKGDVLTLAAE